MIGSKMKSWHIKLLIVLIAVIALLVASTIRGGIDLTSEGRFTISEPVKKLLRELPEPVNIYVMLAGDELPPGFRKLANSTNSFLQEARSISDGKITYQFIEPDEFLADSVTFPLNDTVKTEWLKQSAVKQNEINKQGTTAVFNYPIALVQSGENFVPINLLEGQGNKGFLNPDATGLQLETINTAEAQMEYHFASALNQIFTTSTPSVAYVVGHGEPTGPETFALSNLLQSRYRFYLLNLQTQPYISDSISTVIIVKPQTAFTDAEKLKLDQYVMRGGKLVVLLDALHADMDSLVQSGKDFTAYSRDVKLDDLLFRYGVRVNQNLVQDRQSDVLPQAVGNAGGQPQIEMLPWPYFPLLYSQGNHPITRGLDAVVMQFPNSLDTVKADGISKEVLLRTSNTSRIIGAPVIVTVEVMKQLENPSAWQQQGVPVAVLLQGKFKSLYANRLAGDVADSLRQMNYPYLASGQKAGTVMVTGDGDWVLNSFTRQGPLAMGTNPYTQYQFANETFLLNTLDYLNDENGIMQSRSKEFVLRVLDPKRLENEKQTWQYINIAFPLLLVLFAALMVNWLRKRKFARYAKQ